MVSHHPWGEPCLGGLTSAWQLQAAPREQRNTPRGAATHKTTNRLSPSSTQTLPGVRSRFIASLPETTKISAAATAEGEEKPLCLPTSLGESSREQNQFRQRFLPWPSTSLGTARWGGMGSEMMTKPARRFAPTPADQGSSSAGLGEATSPCQRLTTVP